LGVLALAGISALNYYNLAAAAAPADIYLPRRGAKRSADGAGIETQHDAAAQRNAPARATAAQKKIAALVLLYQEKLSF
jgi:hypothetical protein